MIFISRKVSLIVFCCLFLSYSTIINANFTSNVTKLVGINSTSVFQDLTITYPENKTYTQPDSGYYPATYGFEDTINGNSPKGWTPIEDGGIIEVIEEYQGHKKVMHLYDAVTMQFPRAWNYFSSQTYGTVEFWFLIDDASKRLDFALADPSGVPVFTLVWWSIMNQWRYAIGDSWYVLNALPAPISNTWHHLIFHFERTSGGYKGLAQNRWKAILDETDSGPIPLRHNLNPNSMVLQMDADADYNLYIDAVGYSWDTKYQIGDNYDKGLLLSFQNNTNLVWIGYTLDGQSNININGNTVIKMPDIGDHYIQVFGNDSIGNIHESEITFFRIGGSSPNISPPNPFAFDWIFISVLVGIIGIASLMLIFLLVNRRRTIRMIPKEESPVKTISEVVFACPYCHTEIDPKSNYCPYCSSKIKG